MLQGRRLQQLTQPLLSRRKYCVRLWNNFFFPLNPSTKSSAEILHRPWRTKHSEGKELLEVFPMDSSPTLFIQQMDWTLPLAFTARMTDTNCRRDLGQLPFWVLQLRGCCCGCSLQPCKGLWPGLGAVQLSIEPKSAPPLGPNEQIYLWGERPKMGVYTGWQRKCECLSPTVWNLWHKWNFDWTWDQDENKDEGGFTQHL